MAAFPTFIWLLIFWKDLKPLCFLWSKHRGEEGRRIGESSHPIYHLFYWFGWEQLRHRRRIYDDDPSQTILCVPQSNLANHSALLLLLAVSHVWHTYLFSGSIADTLKGWQKFNICQVVVVTHYQFPMTLNFILPTRELPGFAMVNISNG